MFATTQKTFITLTLEHANLMLQLQKIYCEGELKMKTLKQIYREHGYEVNHDNQKGIGNKCLEDAEKCWREWLTQKREEPFKTKETVVWGEVLPSRSYRIRNEVIDELLAELTVDGETKRKCVGCTTGLMCSKETKQLMDCPYLTHKEEGETNV